MTRLGDLRSYFPGAVKAAVGDKILVTSRLSVADMVPRPYGFGTDEDNNIDFSEPDRLIGQLVDRDGVDKIGLAAVLFGDAQAEGGAEVGGVFAVGGIFDIGQHAVVDLVGARGQVAEQAAAAADGIEAGILPWACGQRILDEGEAIVQLVDHMGEGGQILAAVLDGSLPALLLVFKNGQLGAGRTGVYDKDQHGILLFRFRMVLGDCPIIPYYNCMGYAQKKQQRRHLF